MPQTPSDQPRALRDEGGAVVGEKLMGGLNLRGFRVLRVAGAGGGPPDRVPMTRPTL